MFILNHSLFETEKYRDILRDLQKNENLMLYMHIVHIKISTIYVPSNVFTSGSFDDTDSDSNRTELIG